MTREEIKNRIEEIDGQIWWTNMADRLTYEDYKFIDELTAEKRKLEKELDK